MDKRLLARIILRNALTKRNYGGHGKRPHPTATMNDLPKPEGDFFATHAARQRKHNIILGVGIISAISAIYTWKESGLMTLNWAPPSTYE